jgi:gamma-glutamyl-gamma-aminobutyraldehyde dehydrogenase
MTDLLTHAGYKAIAQVMNPACNALFDGKFQAARSKQIFDSFNPATGKLIANIAACDAKR